MSTIHDLISESRFEKKNHRRDYQNNFMTLKVSEDIPEVYSSEPCQTSNTWAQHMKHSREMMLITQ